MNINNDERNFNNIVEVFNESFNSFELKSLGYQIVINMELFTTSRELLNKYYEDLLTQDFIRSQGGLYNGMLSSYIWTTKMNYSKMKVNSSLLNCITAACRVLKCIAACRNIEKSSQRDWKSLRSINRLKNDFTRLRNALEHIEELILKGLPNDIDSKWGFNRDGVYNYESKGVQYSFDFSETEDSHLSKLEAMFKKFIIMLKQRNMKDDIEA